jgi:hypothetical protein
MNRNPQTKQIEKLLARFFDGATTGEEERTLYHFFRQEEIPAEWEPYRDMFDFFEQGITDVPSTDDSIDLHADLRTPRRRARRLRIAIGIAASVLVVLAASTFLMHQRAHADRLYITRNGIVLTDPAQQSAACREIEDQVRQQYLTIVSAFPDEQSRRAAMQILYAPD